MISKLFMEINMTLDEAIQHCEEKAKCGTACGMEHKQLAEWLKELKTLREEKKKETDTQRIFTR